MKKFIVMLVVLVLTCLNSFGYINVPKNSIPSFVRETAQKNNIKNPDLIFPNQEILVYMGSCVKLPVLVTIKKGDNLTKIVKKTIRQISSLERENRNFAYEILKTQDASGGKLPNSVNKITEEVKTPGIVWIFVICFVIFLFFVKLLYQLFNKKEYPYKHKKG